MALMALRREFRHRRCQPIVEAARLAIARARATGTGLVGDVSNTLVTVPLLRDAVDAGARVLRADWLQSHRPEGHASARLAPPRKPLASTRAASASVSRRTRRTRSRPALFQAIRVDVDAHPNAVTTVHLGESAAEVELLRHGTGPARVMLERLGVWTDGWEIPGDVSDRIPRRVSAFSSRIRWSSMACSSTAMTSLA